MKQSDNTIIIQGIRGLPARHGGFETFAEHLAGYLRDRHYEVIVYCQEQYPEPRRTSTWQGITLVHIPVRAKGSLGSVVFDLLSILDSLQRHGLVLTLGYNTAIFNLLYRLRGRCNLVNMDGIEWRRSKWGLLARAWFYCNEKIACHSANGLIADHPEIARHLAGTVKPDKITMIAYGANLIESSPGEDISHYGLEHKKYLLVIARPEPENSILEIVTAFSVKKRDYKLVVLGAYDVENSYQQAIISAAGEDVMFLGAIYDRDKVSALRYHCYAYIHGHTVGGTNPSLVEALGAGSAILAQDNPYNRWVAAEAGLYFTGLDDLVEKIQTLLTEPDLVEKLSHEAYKRYKSSFTWSDILAQYETLFLKYMA